MTVARHRRARLLIALLAPTALGLVGTVVLQSLVATFWLYLVGGCVLVPRGLLGAGPPPCGHGGLPWRPPPTARWRRAWLPLVVLCGPAFLAVYAPLRPHVGDLAAYRERVLAGGVDLAEPLLPAVLFLALNPLLEEWWWRGQATPRCTLAFGRRAGPALATAAFGLYHGVLLAALFPPLEALGRTLIITAAGAIWAEIARQQRSWRDVYLGHLATNLVMVALVAWLVAPRP